MERAILGAKRKLYKQKKKFNHVGNGRKKIHNIFEGLMHILKDIGAQSRLSTV